MKKQWILMLLSLSLLLLAFTPKQTVLSDETKRVQYISSLGYTVVGEEKHREVIVPVTFGAVYENYNSLQKRAGFDLLPYAGKQITVYSYTLAEDNLVANLLIYKEKLIGGDVCSVALDGRMFPLISRENANAFCVN